MSAMPVDTLDAERVSELEIPDLDARFRIKIATMIQACMPLSYAEYVRNIDVAALRGAGIVTVVTYAEFTIGDFPLAVGASLRTHAQTRHGELSGRPAGEPGARIGFESCYSFSSPQGTGDVRRYREVVGSEPQPCGHGRMVLTMIRPNARPAERLVADSPPQTRHLRLHALGGSQGTGTLLTVPGEFAAAGAAPERSGVFGLHHTDINQYVFTGVYFALLEEHTAALADAAGRDVGRHLTERVAVAFLRPFSAGDRYVLKGTMHSAADRTLATIGIHAVNGEGVSERPAVIGRAEGRIP